MTKFLRIVLPILILLVAAIYINSVFYSAWVAGGPPNNYPEAWAFRSIRHFFYGIGFLIIAVTIFLALKPNAKIIKAKCIIGSSVALILFAVPHVKMFIDVDSCLDQGGKWNKEYHRCDK